MKLCVITNYLNTGYVNEPLIFDKISSLLSITEEDTFDFLDFNSVYKINKNYTHAIVLFDYRTTSIPLYQEYLNEVKISKVFIVDTICHKHKELNKEFIDNYLKDYPYSFTSLSKELQSLLYEKYADGLIFFSELDKQLFNQHYPTVSNKITEVIPPPLGKKEDIKINFNNLSPNTLIGFNGVPSYSNGFIFIGNTLNELKDLNFNLYGTHGREDLNNELLINNILQTSPNTHFKGRLKKYANFFKLHHIYLNPAIYDSFNYFTFLSLLNGMVPIIGKDTGTSSYFKSYPFIAEPNPQSIRYNIELILNTPLNYLKEILLNAIVPLKELSDENIKQNYQTFLKRL
jgi:hypothetical protein